MKLTKAERLEVFNMFGGKCAYCGEDLPEKGWHADHVKAISRKFWMKGNECHFPENDHIDNIFPSCRTCNLYKHCMDIETFRGMLAEQVTRARTYSLNFRLSEKFGLLQVTEKPIVFHFEKVRNREMEIS